MPQSHDGDRGHPPRTAPSDGQRVGAGGDGGDGAGGGLPTR